MPTLRLEPQHPSHAALRASQLQVQDAEPFQGKVRPLRPCGSRARLARNAVPEGFRGHGIVGLLSCWVLASHFLPFRRLSGTFGEVFRVRPLDKSNGESFGYTKNGREMSSETPQ